MQDVMNQILKTAPQEITPVAELLPQYMISL